ncbi:FecR family protein [Pedobacter sp. MR22-3]|uniref:FecR family protein n=1 Tax=Pedobacter sp. MR22-3 TaxID=2994552 RepID=UPI0022467FC7|nr:FecR domain-containing protein [Pedobacter sp. MR22-3]MCX2584320.1 FecR domain-containing protein [Pedobacter sp. MR22-3]
MNPGRLAYLFQRYIDKVCTEAELNELLSLIKNSEMRLDMESILDKHWEESAEIEMNPDRSNAILEKTFSHEVEQPEPLKFNYIKWMGYAAAVIVLGFAIWNINKPDEKPMAKLSNNVAEKKTIVPKNDLITVYTIDEHQKVTLPDSSTVILNAHSSISYPKFFEPKKRNVILKGEGYFDIRHNKLKPFTVSTGKLLTTVLGTAFNIKAYDQSRNIAVTVTRGKVGVTKGRSSLAILLPNQQMIFNTSRQNSSVSKVVASDAVRWQESDIFFDDISMVQAMDMLSRKFGTPITFSDNSMKGCKFSATFLKGESLNEILRVICSFNKAKYQTGKDGITISGTGC